MKKLTLSEQQSVCGGRVSLTSLCGYFLIGSLTCYTLQTLAMGHTKNINPYRTTCVGSVKIFKYS